jgi:hypothetical protein
MIPPKGWGRRQQSKGDGKNAKGYDSMGMLAGEQEAAFDFSEQLEDCPVAHGR